MPRTHWCVAVKFECEQSLYCPFNADIASDAFYEWKRRMQKKLINGTFGALIWLSDEIRKQANKAHSIFHLLGWLSRFPLNSVQFIENSAGMTESLGKNIDYYLVLFEISVEFCWNSEF